MKRLEGLVREKPDEFFARWDAPVTAKDIADFERRFLVPALTQLCQWWDWVSACHSNGVDPFHHPTGLHWQHPFGVYNSLDEGGGTHLDRFVATGDDTGLTRVVDLYPELKV